MNLQGLKDEITALIQTTTNATSTEKQKFRDRMVSANKGDFDRFLAEKSLTDTATNRGKFVAEKTVGNNPPGISGLWGDIWVGQSGKENVEAAPPPDNWG